LVANGLALKPLAYSRQTNHNFPYFIASAPRTIQVCVRFLIAFKFFLDGIPLEMAAQVTGDVAQMTDSGGSMPNFLVRNGFGAGSDGVEPVLNMIPTAAQRELGILERVLGQLRRIGAAEGSINAKGAVFADEDCTTLGTGIAQFHDDVTGIA
jgi:hypothetical protein